VTDRQARDLPLDAHVHTDLSSDSDVPIDEYARQAVERGIAELAITDHVDFRPGAPNYSFSTFEQRERQVREAAERWAPQGVAIRFGAELTYERDFDDDIRAHIRRHAYDFIIGSVHIGADSPFTPARVAGWVAGRSLAEIVEPYYIEVEAAARSGLFDTLGHIDFVKRFLAPHVTATDLATAPELLGPGDQHQRPPPAARGVLPVAGHGRALSRARRGADHHRDRCPPRRAFRLRACGRLRVRGGGRVRVALVSPRRRACRGPARRDHAGRRRFLTPLPR
jgi:HisJ family histidinol phosphate phosphatase